MPKSVILDDFTKTHFYKAYTRIEPKTAKFGDFERFC